MVTINLNNMEGVIYIDLMSLGFTLISLSQFVLGKSLSNIFFFVFMSNDPVVCVGEGICTVLWMNLFIIWYGGRSG